MVKNERQDFEKIGSEDLENLNFQAKMRRKIVLELNELRKKQESSILEVKTLKI